MINQSGEQPAERCLLVLCGLPASGKTTLAKHLLVAASSPPWRDRLSVQIVNFDESLELDAVEFDPTRWKASRRAAICAVDGALSAHRAARSGLPLLVVADDNMHYRSMRYELCKVARTQGAAFVQCHLSCPPEIAAARNAERPASSRVPDDAFWRMAQALEPPDTSHAFESATATIDAGEAAGDAALADAARRLLDDVVGTHWRGAAAASPCAGVLAARKAEGQEANEESLLYQLDLALRKRTGRCIAAAAGDADKRALAQRCGEARRAAMAACREACVVRRKQPGDALSMDTFATLFEQRLEASMRNH